MSKVRADNFTNRASDGAPTFPLGAVVTGVITATTFDGNATTATTATTATNASGLTGTPNIVVGSVTGTTGSFSGDVSIGGTLTYEDVTNIDSVGIITARSGVNITSGGINVTGVSTIPDARLQSVSEDIHVGSGNTATINFTGGDGNIGYINAPAGPMKLEVTNIPTTGFSSKSLSFTVVVQQGTTAYACTAISFNGTDMTIRYSGGTVSTGNTSCIDYFNFVGIDTVGDGAISSYTVTSNVNGDYRLY